MMIRRSQLVGQWQARLSAEEQLAGETARFRWFHQARIRLYRFLLACYGSGQWRADAESADEPLAVHRTQDDPPLSDLEGKPPKSAGVIQAALKSVHGAQDRPPSVGPLIGGLDPDTFTAVTSSDARVDVARCEQFLIDRGLTARVVGRGRRMTVEVPYRQLRQAEILVDSHREMLRPVLKTSLDKLRQNPPLPESTQMLVVGLMLIAPAVGLAFLALGALTLSSLPANGNAATILALTFLGGFIAAAEVSLLWYFVGPRWRKGMTLATRRRIAWWVICICLAVPVVLFLAFSFIAKPSSGNWQLQLVISRLNVAILLMLVVACVTYLVRRFR